MEISSEINDKNTKCDFCNSNQKVRKIISNIKNKNLNICLKCRKTLNRMLRIDLGAKEILD